MTIRGGFSRRRVYTASYYERVKGGRETEEREKEEKRIWGKMLEIKRLK